MIAEINNGCWNCRSSYRVTEFDERGNPLHVHYCNDCTKRCSKCGGLFLIMKFLPDRDSNGFKDWQRTATERHGPLGLLTGRESYIAECMGCRPHYQMPEPPPLAIEEEQVEIDLRMELIESKEEEVVTEDPFAVLERLLGNG